jgi:hypothetical protein
MASLNKLIFSILLPVSIVSFLIHNYLFEIYFSEFTIHYSISKIYLIIFIVSITNIIGIFFVNKIWKDKTGFAFMTLGLIKMFLVIFLVAKLRISGSENIFADGINLSIVYLVSLVPETYISIKLLKISE